MGSRIVEISSASHISTKNKQMSATARDGTSRNLAVPIEDLQAVVIDSPQVTVTSSTLQGMAEAGVALIVSDEHHLPVFIGLPLTGNSVQTAVLRAQATLTIARQSSLWKLIVRTKIQNQAISLGAIHKPGQIRLRALASRVRSGDPANIESQAARMYWRYFFEGPFRRERAGDYGNRLLDYGYALVRSGVARQLVASGLHPSIGIHHHNQYNPFCLADDLMEPLRPSVDLKVRALVERDDHPDGLSREVRSELLSLLLADWPLGQDLWPFPTMVERYVASFKAAVMDRQSRMALPGVLQ